MDPISGVILGVVQGLTEFLPISSSGHLILARELFGLEVNYGLSFDAVLQLATSLAVLLYFRNDFFNIFKTFLKVLKGGDVSHTEKILPIALVIGTIPAVLFGFLLEGRMETTFRSVEVVAYMLIAGSVLFFFAERIARQNEVLTVRKSLWIGLFQTLALIPGMSRSGVTISGGLFFGLTREDAARFSFLLSFPIIFGSGMKKLLELWGNGGIVEIGPSLLSGATVALIVGMLTIHYLLRYLRNHTLNIFIVYRILLASVILILIYV